MPRLIFDRIFSNRIISGSNVKREARDVLITILITFGVIFGSELLLRLIYPERIIDFQDNTLRKDLAYEFNEDFLISLKPNIVKQFKSNYENEEVTVEWKTNKYSFRGNELREKPDLRIIVYGDSNIQARFSELENTFPYRLERYLQGITGRDIEVINAGIIGFGPDQSLIRFMREADVFKPDLVIFHIFADNDFGDVIRNRLFSLDNTGNLISTGYKKSADKFLFKKPEFYQRSEIRNVISSLLITRAVLKVFGLKTKNKNEKRMTIKERIKLNEKQWIVYRESKPRYFSHFLDEYDIDIALYPDSESSTTKIKLMKAVLKRAKEFSDLKRIKFLVVIQPSSRDLTNNLEPNYRDFAKHSREYKRKNLTTAVQNACIENNIQTVNLFETFIRNNPQSLYHRFRSDHWSDAGEDIAAQVVASFIGKHAIYRDLQLREE